MVLLPARVLRAPRWDMSGTALVDSTLLPGRLGLPFKSGFWSPSLIRVRVAGLSVFELKSEKSSERKSEGEVRRIIQDAYTNILEPIQD